MQETILHIVLRYWISQREPPVFVHKINNTSFLGLLFSLPSISLLNNSYPKYLTYFLNKKTGYSLSLLLTLTIFEKAWNCYSFQFTVFVAKASSLQVVTLLQFFFSIIIIIIKYGPVS